MNETDETFTEIKLTNDKSLLYYNKSKVFKVKNKKQIGLDGEIVGKNTTLDTLTYIYDCLSDKIETVKCEKTEIEVIFKFFELANDWIKKIYENSGTDNKIKKYIKEKLQFIHRVNNNSYSFEIKDFSGKDVGNIFTLEKDNWFYTYQKNTYPRWFSLCGGLNFDYDYYYNPYGEYKEYYKINKETNTKTQVSTRDKNGWIVKDGWIDKVGNFFSKNLCCCCCNCYNDDAEMNLDKNTTIINK